MPLMKKASVTAIFATRLLLVAIQVAALLAYAEESQDMADCRFPPVEALAWAEGYSNIAKHCGGSLDGSCHGDGIQSRISHLSETLFASFPGIGLRSRLIQRWAWNVRHYGRWPLAT